MCFGNDNDIVIAFRGNAPDAKVMVNQLYFDDKIFHANETLELSYGAEKVIRVSRQMFNSSLENHTIRFDADIEGQYMRKHDKVTIQYPIDLKPESGSGYLIELNRQDISSWEVTYKGTRFHSRPTSSIQPTFHNVNLINTDEIAIVFRGDVPGEVEISQLSIDNKPLSVEKFTLGYGMEKVIRVSRHIFSSVLGNPTFQFHAAVQIGSLKSSDVPITLRRSWEWRKHKIDLMNTEDYNGFLVLAGYHRKDASLFAVTSMGRIFYSEDGTYQPKWEQFPLS